MHTKRQIHFLLKRFGYRERMAKDYLSDLCSPMKVKAIAKKYNTNTVQVQRDRDRYTERSVRLSVPSDIKKALNKRN